MDIKYGNPKAIALGFFNCKIGENMIDLKRNVKAKQHKAKVLFIILSIILVTAIIFAVSLGRADINAKKIIAIILAKILRAESFLEGITVAQTAIVWSIRLPRILTSVIVGSGLAVAGAVFQSLLMNPLADSYTMGVSSGAAFGACLAIYLNLFISDIYVPVTLAAFIGAFLTLALVVLIARVKGHINTANLVIAGIIVSTILSAGISFIKNAAGEDVAAIIAWLMGSLSARSWEHVSIGFPIVLICILVCVYYAEDLNIMCLGEQEAIALGIDTQNLRRILLISGSLITAVCVSISGIIGFIGLIVPHLLRFMVGSNNRQLVPLSALLGGILLLFADTGARVLLDAEIPVGVLTTLLGGPFFIYIFMTRKKSFTKEG